MDDCFSRCELCPRRCRADRAHGGIGRCGVSDELRIGRAALHFWEEPCISGSRGSGAVFFSGCALGCVFCQNAALSRGGSGRVIPPDRLPDIYASLRTQGAHNINLVTPSHYTPLVARSLERSPGIPVVWNSSCYELPDTLELLRGRVQIFMPDFKYMDPELARKYSGAADYPEAAMAALDKMVTLAGKPVFGEDGLMLSGVLVRHLVLPSHSSDSKKILEYLLGRYGNDIYISIMSQYTPMPGLPFPELARKVRRREYEGAVEYALSLGLTNGFIQEGEAADESFIPEFNGEGTEI